MPQLFPPEIIEFSAEKYYSKFKTRSKVIYWGVLLSVSAAIASLPLIKIDVSTQSRGVIRTSTENILLQSPIYGEVVYYNLHENKDVLQGDTLIAFNAEQLDEQIRFNWEQKAQTDLFILDITRMLRKENPRTSKYMAAYKQHAVKKNDSKIQIDFLRKEFEASQKLFDGKIISEFEYLTSKNSLEKAESVLANIEEDFYTSWEVERTNLEIENQNLISNINQLEKNKRSYAIVAPVSGTLVQVSGFQIGNFIGPNQAIAYISGSDSLLVECYISPSDIGFIKESQSVVFQIDAFDYREWGMIEGSVVDVVKDIVSVSDRPMFRVRCSLNTHCLSLKNGYRGCLQKGMSVTGRFQLTRRSLWQLLFDKIDDWLNPKLIKDEY
jgi:hypothetical protein